MGKRGKHSTEHESVWNGTPVKGTLAELSKLSGIPESVLQSRRCRGVRGEDLLRAPAKRLKSELSALRVRALYDGKEVVGTPKELAELSGLSVRVIKRRISAGNIKPENLLNPVRFRSTGKMLIKAVWNGEEVEGTAKRLSELTGICDQTIYHRYKTGWAKEDILKPASGGKDRA